MNYFMSFGDIASIFGTLFGTDEKFYVYGVPPPTSEKVSLALLEIPKILGERLTSPSSISVPAYTF